MPSASPPQIMFVTGAASGIGRCLAGRLLAAGHALVLTGQDLPTLEAIAAADRWPANRAHLRELDVRDVERWRALIDETLARFGRLDVLWNVAGVIQPGYVHESTPEAVSLHLDVNAKGAMFGSQIAASRMVQQGYGHIVNIASLAALAPVPGIALYTASKFALRGFSLALAEELRPHGVAVTTVCPDAVQTPMLDLQIDYREAALTFSGSRQLTVDEVCDVLTGRVLSQRPLEVTLPRHRGWMAKLTNLWPGIARRVGSRLDRQGLARQAAYKARRDS